MENETLNESGEEIVTDATPAAPVFKSFGVFDDSDEPDFLDLWPVAEEAHPLLAATSGAEQAVTESEPPITIETLKETFERHQSELSALDSELSAVQGQTRRACADTDALDPAALSVLDKRAGEVAVAVKVSRLQAKGAETALNAGLWQDCDARKPAAYARLNRAREAFLLAERELNAAQGDVTGIDADSQCYRRLYLQCKSEEEALRRAFIASLNADAEAAPAPPRNDLMASVTAELASIGKTLTGNKK